MAKRTIVLNPVEWVEPPVSKEESLNPFHSPNGAWEQDGFDEANGGAAELPDDIGIDRLVFPHCEGPQERASRERRFNRENDAEEYRREAFQRSRDFDITLGAKQGKSGPPSPFDDDEKEK